MATCPATVSVLTNLTQELLELKEIVPKESPVYFLIGKVTKFYIDINIDESDFYCHVPGTQQAEQHTFGPYALFLGDGP